MEKMLNWINKNTGVNEAFVGSMPIMANVKLSTNRPICDHPHYEDVKLRDRVKQIYSLLYGYRDASEIHELVSRHYHASYLIMESNVCKLFPNGKPECGMVNIAHLEMAKNSSEQACSAILRQSEEMVRKYFRKVFSANNFYLFKIV